MRRVAVFVGSVCFATAALGAVVQIKVTPDPPLAVGSVVSYEVISNGDVFDWSFEYRCTAPNAPGTWIKSSQAGPTFNMEEIYVGNYEVKGGALEMTDPATMQMQWSYLTMPASIVGPDSDKVAAGMNVNSTGFPQMAVDVHFVCMVGTKQMSGAAIGGYPEERIRRGTQVSAWSKGPGEFYWDTSAIIDHKVVNADVDPVWWNNIQVGEVFDTIYQQNRFVIKDCAGTGQYFYFQERRFQKIKVDAGRWLIREA